MTKFKNYLDDLYTFITSDLPKDHNSIIKKVESYNKFDKIIFLINNSTMMTDYIYNECFKLFTEHEHISDVWLSCLLVLLAKSKQILMANTVSRFVSDADQLPWAKSIAVSFLLKQEMSDDKKLRITT